MSGRTVWFPGHMAKGERKLGELLEKLDLVIEVRDSRAPLSTSSPLIGGIAKLKPVVLVLSKKDLADPARTAIWINELEGKAWAFDMRKDSLTPLRKSLTRFSPPHRELRLAVVGIPNVGKSMFLNSLVGKSRAKVGGIPGVTRDVNWYKVGNFLAVDSPGILDPRAEPGVHRVLSWLGCAKAEVVGGYEAAALEFVGFLKARGLWGAVGEKWGIEDINEPPDETLSRVGRRLGCLVAGGAVNMDLAGKRLLESFASGKLGAVTLELPGEPLWMPKEN
ncbi:MAG: 50S ribosome-binding GTPase [Synergistaceae bacterium]|nr:50S ribosome-binding GTPase [Synergistaceae bacterium]